MVKGTEQLTVTPTSINPDIPTTFQYVGSGWQPEAQLAIGIQGKSSMFAGLVSPDGTFDFPFDWQTDQAHGTVKAYVNARASGGYDHTETVNIHIG